MGREVASQHFHIMPTGRIAGGHFHYTMAPDSGTIHYHGEIFVRRWFRTKSHAFSGEQRIPPIHLRSDHVKVGQSLYLRRVRIRVDHIGDRQAECTVWYDGAYPGEGYAVFDLTSEYVRLKSVSGDGFLRHASILGHDPIALIVYEREDNGDRDN